VRAAVPKIDVCIRARIALDVPDRRASVREYARAVASARARSCRRVVATRTSTRAFLMAGSSNPPAKTILITGARGGVAANLAADLARYVASLDVCSSTTRASLEIVVHDPREYRFAETEDVESSGGVLRFEDVGRDVVDAIVDAVNRYGKSRAREGAMVTARARASGMEGKRLDAEACAACGADVVASCDDDGGLSGACGIAEAVKAVRERRRATGSSGDGPVFVMATARAVTGTVFADAGARTLYEALRPSATCRWAEDLQTRAAETASRDGSNIRDETQGALHFEVLRANPETRPLLTASGAATRAKAPDADAPTTASMCALVAAIALDKIIFGTATASGPARACDQWTHVEAFSLYRPDRVDAHLAPAPNKSEYETLPSGDGDENDGGDEDDLDGFETQGKLFGYDALNKLREMYVLVCGVDSGANDACVSALAAVGVGNVDVLGASGSGRFLRKECEVDDLCDLDDMETYKYHAIIRTSALPAADPAISLASEVKSPVIELATTSTGVSIVSSGLGPNESFVREAFTTWMSTSRAQITAHIAAMEVIRIAQNRARAATLAYDGFGVYEI